MFNLYNRQIMIQIKFRYNFFCDTNMFLDIIFAKKILRSAATGGSSTRKCTTSQLPIKICS
uniref:Uncharacterized protein n=1 Tax=Arundo donax TaxID=35708 RepID=A0A0A9HDJ0_ARUDO